MSFEYKHINKLFINGRWVPPVKGENAVKIPVINPATEEEICKISGGTAEDVDIAVDAARKAFERSGVGAWSTLKGAERAPYLRAISKKLVEKKEYLAKMESLNCGKPFREALWDLDDVAGTFSYYADMAEKLDTKQNKPIKLPDDRFSTVLQYAPTGVVGAIIPWNYPLLMAAWKIAPALAAGCCIILKPSEVTPLTAYELTAIIEEAGLPAGVFNLVQGFGADVGGPLSKHPGIDKVAFTGSVATGKAVMTAASQSLKRVSLELGGKSPFIIFEDADITEATEWIMFGAFWTNGQICSSTSRALIHESIYEKVLANLAKVTSTIHVGDPFCENDPSIGPVVNAAQFKKILKYIEIAKQEGARLVCGGKAAHPKGYYVQPTVFADVKDTMTIWKEEIFGPVLSVCSFKTEEEAIRLANGTEFGLAGAVMSKDQARCDRIIRSLRAGITWVNCSQPAFTQSPWGGMKHSGFGRELGKWGLEGYLEVKQVTTYLVKEPGKWGWYIKSPL